MQRALITLENCRIENAKRILISSVSWTMRTGEVWLVTGANGGGKAAFLSALAGEFGIVPNDGETRGRFFSEFNNAAEIVSLERAAALIQEERENDESEYSEEGVDIGRTGRVFIAEALTGIGKKKSVTSELLGSIAAHRAVKLCGIEAVLDRGLKYMSTGEIRRMLLARALVSEKKLLIPLRGSIRKAVRSSKIFSMRLLSNKAPSAYRMERIPISSSVRSGIPKFPMP